jgi:four helix bundle protein
MSEAAADSVVREKSFAFALDVLRYYQRSRREFGGVLARQMLRSATSIGANVEEARAGQSRRDFIAKMSIASKEARECSYWLRLQIGVNPKPHQPLLDLAARCDELVRLLTAIVKTAQKAIPPVV